MQRNARIESKSIFALLCVAMSLNAMATQRNASPCVILWTGLNNCLPNSALDCECAIIYDQPSTKSHLCASNAFHWSGNSLTERKNMMSWQLLKDFIENLVVPKWAFDVLSPSSKRARFNNMRKTIHQLQPNLNTILRRYNIYPQMKCKQEVGELVSSIISTPHGWQQLCKILTEAERKHEGFGNVLKGIWEKIGNNFKVIKKIMVSPNNICPGLGMQI